MGFWLVGWLVLGGEEQNCHCMYFLTYQRCRQAGLDFITGLSVIMSSLSESSSVLVYSLAEKEIHNQN